ncbi:hypothetical protein MMC19_001832 [Ptychographa xylographoides]|nr:hypothetical protein [Ptychographa xylographoides]
MAGRYIPPALRKKFTQLTNADIPQNSLTGDVDPSASHKESSSSEYLSLDDIFEHFFPFQDDPSLSTPAQTGTLNASATDPDKVAFILLFHEANPRWKDEHIIFTKTRLELLPQAQNTVKDSIDPGSAGTSTGASNLTDISVGKAEQEGSESHNINVDTLNLTSSSDIDPFLYSDVPLPSHPIAVFEQIRGGKKNANFHFAGWFCIGRIAFLEPKSAELVRMLKQKWQREDKDGGVREKARVAESWERSLRQRWAVVRLEADVEAEKVRGPLVVEKAPAREKGPKKTVNELLAEMRMNDENARPGHCDP